MGSSRELAVGPVAAISLLLSSMVQKVADPSVDPTAYRRIVFTATFFAGVFQSAFGFLRWNTISEGVALLVLDLWLTMNFVQVGILGGLTLSCSHCWIHGRRGDRDWSAAAERTSGVISLH